LIIPSLPPFLWVDFSTDNILNTPTSGASNIEICTWWQNAKLFACKRSNFECRWHLHRTNQFSVTRKQGKFCFLLNCHTYAIMNVLYFHVMWLVFHFLSCWCARFQAQYRFDVSKMEPLVAKVVLL
jgi:hypothetical protein